MGALKHTVLMAGTVWSLHAWAKHLNRDPAYYYKLIRGGLTAQEAVEKPLLTYTKSKVRAELAGEGTYIGPVHYLCNTRLRYTSNYSCIECSCNKALRKLRKEKNNAR